MVKVQRGSQRLREAYFIIGCRGVQVGDRNEQYNRYTYELRSPIMDFAPVLRRADVRDAMTRLALDPENEQNRDVVMEKLCAKEWRLVHRSAVELGRIDRGITAPNVHPSPTDQELRMLRDNDADSFVIIRECQGVQVGNGLRQRNDYTYLCSRPRVDVRQMLREHRGLAEAVVDAMIGRASAESVAASLQRAIRSEPVAAPYDGRWTRNGVSDKDGVSYGRDSTVINDHAMEALLHPRRLSRTIAGEADGVRRRRRRLQRDETRAAEQTAAAERRKDEIRGVGSRSDPAPQATRTRADRRAKSFGRPRVR